MKRFSKFTLLKIGLAVGVVGYLIYAVKVDNIVETAAKARLGWIGAALSLLPLNLLLEGASWHLLARREVPGVSLRASYGGLLSGHALGLVTPVRAGDFAARAYYLGHPEKGTLMTLIFIDRLLATVVAVDVGLLALYYYFSSTGPTPVAFWGGLAIFGTATALVLTSLLLLPEQAARLLNKLPDKRWRRPTLKAMQKLDSRLMFTALVVALLRYGVYTTQFFLLLNALTPIVSMQTAYLGIAFVFFAKYHLPTLTFLDIGIREGAAMFFLGQFGYPEAVAFNAAFLLYCCNFIVPASVGIPLVLRLRLGRPTPSAPENRPDA